MNRRAFLKSIAAIGAAAAFVPAALIPQWKVAEPKVLRFKGIPLVYDEMCPPNNVYFLSQPVVTWYAPMKK